MLTTNDFDNFTVVESLANLVCVNYTSKIPVVINCSYLFIFHMFLISIRKRVKPLVFWLQPGVSMDTAPLMFKRLC